MTRKPSKRKVRPVKKAVAKKRNTPLDRLFSAIGKYIEHNGGTAVIAGPVQIMRWPGDAEFKYTLCVQIVGRAPKPPARPKE